MKCTYSLMLWCDYFTAFKTSIEATLPTFEVEFGMEIAVIGMENALSAMKLKGMPQLRLQGMC